MVGGLIRELSPNPTQPSSGRPSLAQGHIGCRLAERASGRGLSQVPAKEVEGFQGLGV